MAFIGSSNETAIKSMLSQLVRSGMPMPLDPSTMDIRMLQEQLMRSNRNIEELERRMRDESRHSRDRESRLDTSFRDEDRGKARSNFFGGALERPDDRPKSSWQRESRWDSDYRGSEDRKRSREEASRFNSMESRASLDMAPNPMFPAMFPMGQDHSMQSSSDMLSAMKNAYDYAYGGIGSSVVKPSYYLEPPPTDKPINPQSEKPLGCHTVYIGGIQETVTEQILEQIITETCGNIEYVRISTGKTGSRFAHIRFINAESVDTAVSYSGSKLWINTGTERFGGRLIIDYSKSREDERDYEAMLRVKEREARHAKNSIEKAVVMYSESTASDVMQNIRSASVFDESFQTLAQWLDRGECTRKTSSTFYNLLSAVHSHIKRIVKEKKEHEEIVQKQKMEQEERAKIIMAQGSAIMKVFKAASKKKCWDHFSKAQRRNIDDWHNQIEKEIKISEEEQIGKREEVGMDIVEEQEENELKSGPTDSQIEKDESGEPPEKQFKIEDSEEPAESSVEEKQESSEVEQEMAETTKAQDLKFRAQNESLRALAQKNSSLIWEVEGYKKEIVDLKQKFASVFQDKDLQIARLMTAVQGLQTFLQNVSLNSSETNQVDVEVEVKPGVDSPSTSQNDSMLEESVKEGASAEEMLNIKQEKTDDIEKEEEKVDQKKTKKRKPAARKRRSRARKKDTEENEATEEEPQEKESSTEATSTVTADDSVTEESEKTSQEKASQKDVLRLSSQDMAVVGLLCSYLQVCPYGATSEQVLVHIQRHVPGVATDRLAEIMEGLPMLFAGDGLEFYNKTWTFNNNFMS